MTKKKVAWREFEQYVAGLHQQFGQAEHNAFITGTCGLQHQIDVLFSDTVGLYPRQTLVSCKAWSSRVKKEQVMTLKATMDDCNANGGALFSTRGFQAGAIQYARHYNIHLFQVTRMRDSDWDGFIGSINIRFVLMVPNVINVKPEMAPLEQSDTLTPESIILQLDKPNASLFNDEGQVIGNLLVDMEQAMNTSSSSENPVPHRIPYESPTFLLIRKKFYRINAINFEVQYEQVQREAINIDFQNRFPFKLIDTTSGQVYLISRENTLHLTEIGQT